MTKESLRYFQNDTDRFQDIRIKRLKKQHGSNGFAVYDYLLHEIYRVKGYYLKFDEPELFDVADYWSLLESDTSDIIKFCCSIGLFDNRIYFEKGILTSQSIQRRFLEMSKRAKRKGTHILEEIALLPEESSEVPEESGENQEESDKVKYTNNKSIENKETAAAATDFNLEYENLGKDKKTIVEFIRHKHPDIIKPYVDLWNLFATEKGDGKNIHEVKRITNKISGLFKDRILDQDFDFLKILEVAKDSDYALKSEKGWFTLEWILSLDKDGDPNYIKVIEGKYRNVDKEENPMNTMIRKARKARPLPDIVV
jgi:hypothetical protein